MPPPKTQGLVTYKALAAILVGIGGIVGWYVESHVPKEIDSALSSTKEKISKIEGIVETLQSAILRKATVGSPEDVKTKLVLAGNYLNEAKSKEIIIDPNLIRDAGQQVVAYESNDPAVSAISWNTAIQFVEYRSFLNEKLYKHPGTTLKANNHQMFGPAEQPPVCCFNVQGMAIENTRQPLDWGRWNTVLFVNSTIIYEGNPMTLKDVYFENCTFQIRNTDNGKKLSSALLISERADIQF